MARYEYNDEKSSKFWEIEQDGHEFTVRYGRIGSDGQSKTKLFDDAATATKEAEKLIRSKTKKGYELVPETPSEESAAAVASGSSDERNPELEAAIIANPGDEEAWAVYADWLGTVGDARGELIALGIQLEETSDAVAAAGIQKRMQEIEGACRESWLGDDFLPHYRAALELPRDIYEVTSKELSDLLHLEWRYGFIVEAAVRGVYEGDVPSGEEVLRSLLRSPAARFLQKLRVGKLNPNKDYGDHGRQMHGFAEILTEAGPLPALREVYIGELLDMQAELSWTSVDDVSPIFPVLPNLESLHIRSGEMDLGQPGAIRHEKLRELTLETGGLSEASFEAIIAAELPGLLDLDIWTGDENYGAEVTVEHFEPLLNGNLFPKLKRLGLVNSELTNDFARVLPESAILSQVKILDLSLGTMTDEGAQRIVDHAEAYRHLEYLDLSENFISDGLCSRLRALFQEKVNLDAQDEPDLDGDEVWTYVSVGE